MWKFDGPPHSKLHIGCVRTIYERNRTIHIKKHENIFKFYILIHKHNGGCFADGMQVTGDIYRREKLLK